MTMVSLAALVLMVKAVEPSPIVKLASLVPVSVFWVCVWAVVAKVPDVGKVTLVAPVVVKNKLLAAVPRATTPESFCIVQVRAAVKSWLVMLPSKRAAPPVVMAMVIRSSVAVAVSTVQPLKLGLVAKTRAPVPVSSLNSPEIPAEVVTLVRAPVPVVTWTKPVPSVDRANSLLKVALAV